MKFWSKSFDTNSYCRRTFDAFISNRCHQEPSINKKCLIVILDIASSHSIEPHSWTRARVVVDPGGVTWIWVPVRQIIIYMSNNLGLRQSCFIYSAKSRKVTPKLICIHCSVVDWSRTHVQMENMDFVPMFPGCGSIHISEQFHEL